MAAPATPPTISRAHIQAYKLSSHRGPWIARLRRAEPAISLSSFSPREPPPRSEQLLEPFSEPLGGPLALYAHVVYGAQHIMWRKGSPTPCLGADGREREERGPVVGSVAQGGKCS
jgi:hypothetical protein